MTREVRWSRNVTSVTSGNSFTYYNDLPAMVAEMAASDGRAYEYDSHLEGGWSWEKHAASEVTMDKIRSRQWDVVVLQEYSTRAAYPEDDVCIQTVSRLTRCFQVFKIFDLKILCEGAAAGCSGGRHLDQ